MKSFPRITNVSMKNFFYKTHQMKVNKTIKRDVAIAFPLQQNFLFQILVF